MPFCPDLAEESRLFYVRKSEIKVISIQSLSRQYLYGSLVPGAEPNVGGL